MKHWKWVLMLAGLLAFSACQYSLPLMIHVKPGRPGVTVEMNQMVPMRDGVKLAVDIYRPKHAKGKLPAILTIVPYGTDSKMLNQLGRLFASHGLVFLAVDCRGIQHSEGKFFPLVWDWDDDHDIVAWIDQQPWFNGNLGTWGASYFGYTQWEAAADSPSLKAMVPLFTSPNMRRIVFNGGALELIMVEGWLSGMKSQTEGKEKKPDYNYGYFNQPLRNVKPLDISMLHTHPEMLELDPMMLITHPGDSEFARPVNFSPYYSHVSAAALLVAGWFDQFEQPELDDFVHLRAEGIGDAKKSRLIVGPWTHGMPSSAFEKNKYSGVRLYAKETFDWYSRWLLGKQNGAENKAPVKIFIMGENKWRDEQEWPLARTQYTKYYLRGTGPANARSGQGTVSTTAPGPEPADRFSYDPKNPVPTKGGTFQPFTGHPAGTFDQSEMLGRDDVLYFQTEPLTQGVEVTGPISVKLYAASSAKDTDFVAMLLDVHPDGSAWYIQDGCIRARYRNGYQKPTLIEPGKVYEYTIDLWSTSNYFKPGHRIAVEITSSNFPQYDRNTNAGGEGGPDNVIVAEQKIYHDEQHPSYILLPVIPR
jgi:uncharacterized protein